MVLDLAYINTELKQSAPYVANINCVHGMWISRALSVIYGKMTAQVQTGEFIKIEP
jgi:hypothetical protein